MPNQSPPTPADELLRGPIKSKTVFPALVLHLLAGGPDHGFALMQRIEGVCSGVLAVNTNTIYPLLRRLEERGFITGEWDHPTKRSRRMYSITPAGRERLARIKANMLPYLDHLAASVARLRSELYDEPNVGPIALAAASSNGHAPVRRSRKSTTGQTALAAIPGPLTP